MKNNNPFIGGVPDVWYSGDKADLWIEYKYANSLPKDPLKKLSALQCQWIDSRRREGRHVWIVFGTSRGGYISQNAIADWKGPFSKLEVAKRIEMECAKWIGRQHTS